MSITYHERPGVYSDYDASSIDGSRDGAERVIALIGTFPSAASGRLHADVLRGRAGTYSARTASSVRMLKLAYQNGAGTVLAYPVAEDSAAAYAAAVAAVLAEKQASLCVLGSAHRGGADSVLHGAFRRGAAEAASASAFAAWRAATAAQLGARAQKLNCERVVFDRSAGVCCGRDGGAGRVHGGGGSGGGAGSRARPGAAAEWAGIAGACTGVTAVYSDTEYDALAAAGRDGAGMRGRQGAASSAALTTRSKTGGSAPTRRIGS